MTSGLLDEATRYGFNLSISDGCSWCGPVSVEKLKLEVNRYFSVISSIKSNGFKLDDAWENAISVVALVDDDNGKYCYLLADGAHRFAACAALGFQNIPYKINGSIFKSEVSSWPNVQSGMYTQEGAIRIFDRFINGRLPSMLLGKDSNPVLATRPLQLVDTTCGFEAAADSIVHNSVPLKSHPVAGDCYYGYAASNYELHRSNKQALLAG